ncbi:MAG: Ldh family oxidoreductase [Granulosicoccus sp.]
MTLSLDEVFTLARQALAGQGLAENQASAIARTITAAERDGCQSHGLFRVPFYVAALQNPGIDPAAEPVVSVDSSAVVHVDAGCGFCPLALERGLEHLVERAQALGIAAMAIHRSYNIAALWPEVEHLANAGLIAFAFTASNAYVAPAGGSKPLYGTNPMAFAWPRAQQPPLVFDQASSVSARGEIQLHQQAGQPLPGGWAIDVHGEATTDPASALAGAQLAFGGYKGASLALMIELLAGALIGDLFSFESSAQDVHNTGAPFGGEFLIAISPGRCAPGASNDAHLERAEALFTKILSQDGTRLPSDRRYQARVNHLANGIEIPAPLYEELQGLASE